MYLLNKKAIKSFAIILGLVILGSLIPGCESNQPNLVNPEAATVELQKSTVVDFQTIEKELQKLLHHLIQHPEILTPDRIKKAAERYITIPELGLDDMFVPEFQLEDGNTFEVYVELFNGSAGNELSVEGAEVCFILDPDRFPKASEFTSVGESAEFTARIAATNFNKNNGLYRDQQSQRKMKLHSKTDKINALLFFVGGEERTVLDKEETNYTGIPTRQPGLSKVLEVESTDFIWLTGIQLKAKKDISNEEFELYYTHEATVYIWGAFYSNTHFKFNGSSHEDATGIDRIYPDVNTNGYYEPIHPIAIAVCDEFKICAIEDDDDPGDHINDIHNSAQQKHQENGMYGCQIAGTGQTPVNNYSFWFSVNGNSNVDDDDIFEKSLIRWWGTNPPPSSYSQVYHTDHVNYWLRVGTIEEAGTW